MLPENAYGSTWGGEGKAGWLCRWSRPVPVGAVAFKTWICVDRGSCQPPLPRESRLGLAEGQPLRSHSTRHFFDTLGNKFMTRFTTERGSSVAVCIHREPLAS